MGYSELIKDFNRIRTYLRSFYVYGFRHRKEYTQKSSRGYDNERRRVESWLGRYMTFSQDTEGRRVFLSVDSRTIPENSLYQAFRAKSFTDGDITLHFLLMDILPEENGIPISKIMRQLVERLYEFDSLDQPDESTVRKKMKEYVDLGVVCITKKGRETLYRRSYDKLDLETWDAAAIRHLDDWEIFSRFFRAWAEDRDLALKILFYARDVRGGLGERRVFRSILSWLALLEPESIRKNIALIPFYGRYDDLLELLGTSCEADVLNFIRTELAEDTAALAAGKDVSLLAKWLPSVNASSEETRRKAVAIARGIGMSDSQYRRTLSNLRSAERILENRLRERDYSFSYSAQPSRAMFKYRQAFLRNDKRRYQRFLRNVETGRSTLHTAGVVPYELIRRARDWNLDTQERHVLDVTWNALEDYTNGRNALAVVDVSGSMTWQPMGTDGPLPIDVAVSLGLYFAERNKGAFRNHFITFSDNPGLSEVKGEDLADKVRYIMSAPWGGSTNIQAVFELILKTAVENDLPQSELPETLYIISDMEFNSCTRNADLTNFEYAKNLFEDHGYRLPSLVFWNVQSRNQQSPVKMNEQGAALISGASPRIFSLVAKGELDLLDPYKFMLSVIRSNRYVPIYP